MNIIFIDCSKVKAGPFLSLPGKGVRVASAYAVKIFGFLYYCPATIRFYSGKIKIGIITLFNFKPLNKLTFFRSLGQVSYLCICSIQRLFLICIGLGLNYLISRYAKLSF